MISRSTKAKRRHQAADAAQVTAALYAAADKGKGVCPHTGLNARQRAVLWGCPEMPHGLTYFREIGSWVSRFPRGSRERYAAAAEPWRGCGVKEALQGLYADEVLADACLL
jgi:hypothetical protein